MEKQVPRDLLNLLSREIKNFGQLGLMHKCALAYMFEVCDTSWKQHAKWEDSASFNHKDLNVMFGRSRFGKVNKQVGMFEVTNQYYSDQGLTRGYKLTPNARRVKNKYLKVRQRPVTELLELDGKVIRNPPKSVSAKDISGRTTVWNKAKPPNVIPVDLDALIALEKQTRQTLDASSPDLFQTDHAKLARRLNDLGLLIRRANTTAAGRSNLMQRYQESDSGRLYAQGINLQKIPRVIRQAALAGCWDYDIDNCHYSIFSQLSDRYGYETKAINHYLNQKKAIREELAADLGLGVGDIKTCLISAIYGARDNLFPKNAIPTLIGGKAEQLFKHEVWRAIYKDVLRGRGRIVDSQEVNRKGWIHNALGKPIKEDKTREKILAHLLQGIEAQALRAIVQTVPDQVLLLVHDGFVTRKRIKQSDLEAVMLRETGFNLNLSGNKIQISPDYD